MADTFFSFDTAINNGDNLLPDDDIENEEEYDALNDETFGTIEDTASLDDWEQQHEQYAEIAENSRQTGILETALCQFVFDDLDDESIPSPKSSVWSFNPTSKNGAKENDIFSSPSLMSSLQQASKAFIEGQVEEPYYDSITNILNSSSVSSASTTSTQQKICTVEELEKNLIKSSTKNVDPPQRHSAPSSTSSLENHTHGRPPYHPPIYPYVVTPNARPPPGLPPLGVPPPNMRLMNHQMKMPHHNHLPPVPPGFMHMGPNLNQRFMNLPPPPRPPGLIFPPNGGPFNVPPNFNFPPPPRHMNNMNVNQLHRNNHHQQHQQRQRHDSSGSRHRDGYHQEVNKDEYSGLMSPREKQWLLNIQLLQLNTGTPYFDDYYYTVFKERKAKANKENMLNDRSRYQNGRQRRNSERQDSISASPLTPRVYTPLQFENSLGKLQCGSVTAPRKIIDMDIVAPDKDPDTPTVSKDTRKTKQLLLELEALYSLLLKAEDLKNPVAISNMEKLREIKQKQRLRELEVASTTEQKQEILRLFKLESVPVVENQHDYILRIVQGLIQEDKFSSFLNIRKGKMLLLRVLPHLKTETFPTQLFEIWNRTLLSLPIVGRRDTAGDQILPQLLPFFKKYIQSVTMDDILEITNGLMEAIRQENSRSTPLSHQGRAPLYFVLLNKFGVSALVILLIRTEYLISSDKASEKQISDWFNFLSSWAEQTALVDNKVAAPLELIPIQIFSKHCNRFVNLSDDKKSILEKEFADCF